jgi:hypothetical protein
MSEESRQQVLATGKEFIQLLQEMEVAYQPHQNVTKRWVIKHLELVTGWVDRLEAVSTPEQANTLWRDLQTGARILENAMPDELGRRYRALKSKLIRQMVEYVAEVRKTGG